MTSTRASPKVRQEENKNILTTKGKWSGAVEMAHWENTCHTAKTRVWILSSHVIVCLYPSTRKVGTWFSGQAG